MQVYKVVEKKTRHCSNWAIFKSHEYCNNIFWKKFRKNNLQYFPRYFKGRVVEAVKGTIGILTFEYLEAAELFIKCNNAVKNLIIIKVEGIGDERRVYHLKGNCGGKPTNILRAGEEMAAPQGTLAFESVKVLE
jgi:hypothetical protein